MKLLLALLVAASTPNLYPAPIHGVVADNSRSQINACDVLHDDTIDIAVYHFPKAPANVVVRVRSFDQRGNWIADDLVEFPNADMFGIVPIIRPPGAAAPFKVECSVDAMSYGNYALGFGRDISRAGDLAYCARALLFEPSDDNGPLGNIQSVSIGRDWLGVSFHAYVNGFMAPSYGRLHQEPFAFFVDGRLDATLHANGLSDDLSFFTHVKPGHHDLRITFADNTSVGWAACLNRVAP